MADEQYSAVEGGCTGGVLRRGPGTSAGQQRVVLPDDLGTPKFQMNLRQVQKQLGHASPATTANMYADVTFDEMKDGVTGLYDD